MGGSSRVQQYVVIRTEWDPMQRLIFPRDTVIYVSRADLPIEELMARHRHKQGMEKELKGPLEASGPASSSLSAVLGESDVLRLWSVGAFALARRAISAAPQHRTQTEHPDTGARSDPYGCARGAIGTKDSLVVRTADLSA